MPVCILSWQFMFLCVFCALLMFFSLFFSLRVYLCMRLSSITDWFDLTRLVIAPLWVLSYRMSHDMVTWHVCFYIISISSAKAAEVSVFAVEVLDGGDDNRAGVAHKLASVTTKHDDDHSRRSSVNFRVGARHFCPKKYVWKINKMPEFY